MIQEALFAVEKAKPHNVSVKDVHCCPPIQRQLVPVFLEPKRPLIGRPSQGWSDWQRNLRATTPYFFYGCSLGKAHLFRNPERHIALFLIILDHIILDALRVALHVEMLIDEFV